MTEETKVDNDPTGMYARAAQIHEMAVRKGVIVNGRYQAPAGTEPPAAEVMVSEPTRAHSILDETFSDAVPTLAAANGGWVPKKPDDLPDPEQTELTQRITTATRIFPSLERVIDQIKRLWPNGTNPIFDEVNADVTHPLTPTGKPAKRGPKLPYTEGMPWEEYVALVQESQKAIPRPVTSISSGNVRGPVSRLV